MVTNRKVTGRTVAMPIGLGLGAAVSLGSTLVLAMLTAKCMDNQWLAEKNAGYASVRILLLSSFLGAAMAYGKVRRHRGVVCMASGGIYYGTLLLITALFFGGQYQGMGVTALVVLAGCVTYLLLGSRDPRKKRRKSHARS